MSHAVPARKESFIYNNNNNTDNDDDGDVYVQWRSQEFSWVVRNCITLSKQCVQIVCYASLTTNILH